jgi:hypothetical protein
VHTVICEITCEIFVREFRAVQDLVMTYSFGESDQFCVSDSAA